MERRPHPDLGGGGGLAGRIAKILNIRIFYFLQVEYRFKNLVVTPTEFNLEIG
ncbi:hypothetical protein HGB47_13480 [Leptospira yasudae]|uniref:hypothetical protein n=1 Tax=Leptospira yasudae TaxID=2202201 RepID=UPI001C4F0B8D|nr:hypothetical protein [Leptospira yasudae]MBW0434627.1 hypothetical protein [Leptospira yasudae]